MPTFLCTTCGVSYPPAAEPPARCAICDEERQYISPAGQTWTTLEALARTHGIDWRELEPGLFGLAATPQVGIGQRALFIAQAGGGVLWDCTPLAGEAGVQAVAAQGGLRAIAISHPHFYSTMVDWSHRFGGVPIYLHEDDSNWVMRPDPAIVFWSGETFDLGQGLNLVRCGGHFAGSSVLHWSGGAGGEGALLTGDTIMVVPDPDWMSFMRSYPNLLPLSATAVRRIVDAVAPYAFDRLYAGWWERVCARNAGVKLQRSAARYIAAIEAQ